MKNTLYHIKVCDVARHNSNDPITDNGLKLNPSLWWMATGETSRMSKDFVVSFFPVITAQGRIWAPRLVELVFPDDVSLRCPEIVMQIYGFPIRNPVLGVGAVVGMLIGGGGAWRLQSACAHPSNRMQWQPFQLSFLFFGMMNAVALPLHCILPHATDMPLQYPLWWALDCLFTGLSATALSGGCFNFYRYFSLEATLGHRLAYFTTWGLLGTVTLSTFAVYRFVWRLDSYALELFYLIPIAIAGCSVCPLLIWSLTRPLHNKDASRRLAIAIASGCCTWGVLLVVLGLALDAAICRYVGQYYDTLMVATTTFWGCDFAFLGILSWLYCMMGSSSPKGKFRLAQSNGTEFVKLNEIQRGTSKDP